MSELEVQHPDAMGQTPVHGDEPWPASGMVHRVPRGQLVDRVDYLVDLAAGRRVIDLGFVDHGRMELKRGDDAWLHDRLSRSAAEIVGIDLDSRGVGLARELGFEAYAVDCQSPTDLEQLAIPPADVVIAGELVEHLDRPGAFLDSVKCLVKPPGVLVLTTPNATSFMNFLASLVNRELVNPDHVAWYSLRVLTTLLERHDWLPRELAYYAGSPLAPRRDAPLKDRSKRACFNALRAVAKRLARVYPALADGIVITASPREVTSTLALGELVRSNGGGRYG